MNKRKISLLGIDILIIVLVYLFVWGLLSRLRSSSLVFSYGFGPLKLVFLIVFLIGGRLVAKVYSSIWRYANENTYIRLILSDLIMSGVFSSCEAFSKNFFCRSWPRSMLTPMRMPAKQAMAAQRTMASTFPFRGRSRGSSREPRLPL